MMSDREFYESPESLFSWVCRALLWALRALGFAAVVYAACLALVYFQHTPSCKSVVSALTQNCVGGR